jgi:hypothetical protein
VYRFGAQRFDQGTGTYDVRFRDYSPGVGNFLTADHYSGQQADLRLGPVSFDTSAQGSPGVWEWLKDQGRAFINHIKEDPWQFAGELAIGAAAAIGVGLICATGIGCAILAGVAAGAAAAAYGYGVDVAQGEHDFDTGDFIKTTAIGAAVGGLTAGIGYGIGRGVSRLIGSAAAGAGEGAAGGLARAAADEGGPATLYHYSPLAKAPEILNSGKILASGADIPNGPGVFLTDIAPQRILVGVKAADISPAARAAGKLSVYQAARRIMASPWNYRRLQYYFKIDVRGLPVRPVVGDPRISNVFVIPGNDPLLFIGRLIEHGPLR